MNALIEAEVYSIRTEDSTELMRYAVLMKIDLVVRQFVGLVREEVSDRTTALPSIEVSDIEGGPTMVWAEELSCGLSPLNPKQSRVLEDIFQERLTSSLEACMQEP